MFRWLVFTLPLLMAFSMAKAADFAPTMTEGKTFTCKGVELQFGEGNVKFHKISCDNGLEFTRPVNGSEGPRMKKEEEDNESKPERPCMEIDAQIKETKAKLFEDPTNTELKDAHKALTARLMECHKKKQEEMKDAREAKETVSSASSSSSTESALKTMKPKKMKARILLRKASKSTSSSSSSSSSSN